jgi:hypothetical protein
MAPEVIRNHYVQSGPGIPTLVGGLIRDNWGIDNPIGLTMNLNTQDLLNMIRNVAYRYYEIVATNAERHAVQESLRTVSIQHGNRFNIVIL